MIPTLAGPSDLLPLPALATDDLSPDALRIAAVRGRLKAANDAWLSHRAWVDEYKASRYRHRTQG